MTNKKIRWDFWTIVTVVIIALFALFLLYPLISLFLSGFKDTETGVWTIDNYARFFSKKYYKSALLNSFKLTFSVTVVAIILGVPLAYFMSFYKIKGKGLLEILFIIHDEPQLYRRLLLDPASGKKRNRDPVLKGPGNPHAVHLRLWRNAAGICP